MCCQEMVLFGGLIVCTCSDMLQSFLLMGLGIVLVSSLLLVGDMAGVVFLSFSSVLVCSVIIV